eukprot:9203752-Alexandrium_andersonii.AAC.1
MLRPCVALTTRGATLNWSPCEFVTVAKLLGGGGQLGSLVAPSPQTQQPSNCALSLSMVSRKKIHNVLRDGDGRADLPAERGERRDRRHP